MPVISAPDLTGFAEQILLAAATPAHKASIAAASLVASNLRGKDSHGIQLLPFYIDQILAGEMDTHADGRVISESGSCLHFDGQNGLGQWIADTCCRHAVRIAGQQGMAMVVARDSNHFGAAAWWAQKIRAAGQIGIVMCNASPLVPPWPESVVAGFALDDGQRAVVLPAGAHLGFGTRAGDDVYLAPFEEDD